NILIRVQSIIWVCLKLSLRKHSIHPTRPHHPCNSQGKAIGRPGKLLTGEKKRREAVPFIELDVGRIDNQ
ncbi:MAG TPA: hypothetical protein VMW42_03950, partial [Desulfatiglandales bacterium]|nr:hypothetical protein [Desulfatiglandales bacterium]